MNNTNTINKSKIPKDYADKPFILTFDIGSSSLRTMLFDRRGRMIEGTMSKIPYQLKSTVNGMAEIDADYIFNNFVISIDKTLMKSDKLAKSIKAVSGASFVFNILGLDSSYQPVTPVFTYADYRNERESLALQRKLDEHNYHNNTGCMLRASHFPARFLWLKRTRPTIVKTIKYWVSIGEYVYLKLFNKLNVSFSIASWTGLFDRHNFNWEDSIFKFLNLSTDSFSNLIDIDNVYQGLALNWRKRWPTLKNLPWIPPINDGAAANVGSGCLNNNTLALTIGTTSSFRITVPKKEFIQKGFCEHRLDKYHTLVSAPLNEGGNVFAWLQKIFNINDFTEIDYELLKLKPTEHDLIILPFLNGERAPGWVGDAKSTIKGINSSTNQIDIIHAFIESISYQCYIVYSKLIDNFLKSTDEKLKIIVSGGSILRLNSWMQIMADVLGKKLFISSDDLSTSRGAAFVGLCNIGLLDDIKQAPVYIAKQISPNISIKGKYDEAIKKQKDLYDLFYNRD